jgi:hypothetical protein
VNDHDRIVRLEERQQAVREALVLQAREYERRLEALNGENARILRVQSSSVTAEKFDDYKATQTTALQLALDLVNGRLTAMENWKAKATGIGLVLVLVSGVIGAAIARALG